MGLFDAVRSLFGGDSKADDEGDVSPTDEDEAERDHTDETTARETDDTTARETDEDAPTQAESEQAAAWETKSVGTENRDETDDGIEAAEDSDGMAAETGEDDEDDATAADENEDEPISWEETGFEQLTTELVEDDEDEDDEGDPADLIQEAEPDRAEDDESEDATDEGGMNLPLDEEAAGTDTEAEDEDAVDVPEDSPRAEFVADATELAEFWSEYDLDFTVDSLSRVDELLDEQWGPDRFETAEFGGDDYDSEVFTGLVREVGSYLGEVLVRTYGGEWTHQEGVGWTVDLPAGPDSEAAGATVTVFHMAETAVTTEETIVGKHEGLVAELGLGGADAEEPAAPATTLETAEFDAVTGQDTDIDVAARLREGAEDLAERWPDFDLDFSVDSLSRLEELLDDELDRERFADAELGDETDHDSMLLTAHAVGVGGYLAEVLRRHREGEWDTDRMVIVVETTDGEQAIDPIDVAVNCLRDEQSLVEAVPESA